MPFYEPGAEELLRRGLRSGRFRLAPDVAAATAEAEAVFLCVGTPQRDEAQGSSVGSTVSPTTGSTSFPCAPTDAPEGPELESGQERGFCVK
jgi:UDPglucose 6-dehydrogenase